MNNDEIFTYAFEAVQITVDLLAREFLVYKEKGGSLEDLAATCKVRPDTLSNILKGKVCELDVGTTNLLLRAMGKRIVVSFEDIPQTNQQNEGKSN